MFCQVKSSLNVNPRYLLLSGVFRTWLYRVFAVLITLFFVTCILITVHIFGFPCCFGAESDFKHRKSTKTDNLHVSFMFTCESHSSGGIGYKNKASM